MASDRPILDSVCRTILRRPNTRRTRYPFLTTSQTVEKRASTRLSTYSMTPTLAPSIAPSHISNAPSLTPSEKASPLAQEVSNLQTGLARLEDPKLESQRYNISDVKKEEINKLALGAKIERALGRRMVGQDATFSSKKNRMPEKEVAT